MTAQKRPVILVVDDDDFQHKLVQIILGHEQYEMVFASGGEQALRLLGEHRVDLVLMDVQMPGFDGLEATRRMKSVPQTAQVPVLMVSGSNDEKVVAQCLQAGAADFVLKPFDRAILPAKVAMLLERTAC